MQLCTAIMQLWIIVKLDKAYLLITCQLLKIDFKKILSGNHYFTEFLLSINY